MRKKFLLGVKENCILIGEIEITDRNGYKEFTASFDEGEAFRINDIDFTTECESLWECYDAQAKLDLLYDGDRTRDEVFDDWTRYSDYHEFIDCSCTDIEISIDDELINFQTTSCGQHDIREYSDFNNWIFTNKKAFDLIMELWDGFHLKKITEKQEKKFNKICELLQDFGVYDDKSEEFLKNNIIL